MMLLSSREEATNPSEMSQAIMYLIARRYIQNKKLQTALSVFMQPYRCHSTKQYRLKYASRWVEVLILIKIVVITIGLSLQYDCVYDI